MNSSNKTTPTTPTTEAPVIANQNLSQKEGSTPTADRKVNTQKRVRKHKSKSISKRKKIDFVHNEGFKVANIISIPGDPKPAYQDVANISVSAPVVVQNIINSVTDLVMALNYDNTDKIKKDSKKLQDSIDALVKIVPFISSDDKIKELKSTTEYTSVKAKALKILDLWNEPKDGVNPPLSEPNIRDEVPADKAE